MTKGKNLDRWEERASDRDILLLKKLLDVNFISVPEKYGIVLE